MSLKKLGRYDIIRPLGQGSMGLVYEAHDPNLDRRVAIKTIRVADFSDTTATEYELRFRAEARAGGRLQHPNIIGVYDAGRDEGMAFMVMELVRGGDLKQLLDRGARPALPLPFDRTFAIMRELLAALAFAHEQNIIHRDVKPSNVMLDAAGKVKLGDFGVARITDSGDATRTQGSIVGTLKYMSPEQVQGLKVDSRTDLFAAGVVLYQMLTGIKPFDGTNDFAIMQAIVQHEPAPPSTLVPDLPAGIDAVVAAALAKQRDRRYVSARDFMLELRAVAQQTAGGTFPPNIAPAERVASTPGASNAAFPTTDLWTPVLPSIDLDISSGGTSVPEPPTPDGGTIPSIAPRASYAQPTASIADVQPDMDGQRAAEVRWLGNRERATVPPEPAVRPGVSMPPGALLGTPLGTPSTAPFTTTPPKPPPTPPRADGSQGSGARPFFLPADARDGFVSGSRPRVVPPSVGGTASGFFGTGAPSSTDDSAAPAVPPPRSRLPRRAMIAAALLVVGVAAGAGYQMFPEPTAAPDAVSTPTSSAPMVASSADAASANQSMPGPAAAASMPPSLSAAPLAVGTPTPSTPAGQLSTAPTLTSGPASSARLAEANPTPSMTSNTAPARKQYRQSARPTVDPAAQPAAQQTTAADSPASIWPDSAPANALQIIYPNAEASTQPARQTGQVVLRGDVPGAGAGAGTGTGASATALRAHPRHPQNREYPAAMPGTAAIDRLMDCRARQQSAAAAGQARSRGECR